ncbi:MAG: GspE/PulE family protein [Phycisphaerales bacterium]
MLTDLHPDHVTDRFRTRIPRDFAREHLVVSIGTDEDRERLAVAGGTPATVIHNVGVRLGAAVLAETADDEAIARTIDEAYGRHDQDVDGDMGLGDADDLDARLLDADRDLLATQGKGPVVRLVDSLLFEALTAGASDIHIQPLADHALVRLRRDGVLHEARELSRDATLAVTSRIKVMGRMDIAERRIPQDGRATVRIGDRSIDLRISTIPTSHGERAVLRLLDHSNQLCDFDALAMPQTVHDGFLAAASRANGLILVTGPTGSGKTTTLYSTLRRIATPGVNIMTIEDPIEYELTTTGLSISQSQINTRKGVSFATGLRHILRQDPDVVMVGEIRDAETARIAVQSSLTGHLVLSTLHTNDAASAVSRLLDLDVEPFLVSSSLATVLAQRLVRRRHAACDGAGCEDCIGTGYAGRMGIFELLQVDDEMRGLISARATLERIRAVARAAGFGSLADEGRRLVAEGLTTEAEVFRVIEGMS